MSLVTVGKNTRAYPRRFDHEECRRLREETGWSGARLARHFGVSTSRVYQVIDPRSQERVTRQRAEHIRGMRRPCLGGCGRLVWMHMAGRSGYCVTCSARRRTKGVRPTTLLCSTCDRWLPDEDFHRRSDAINRRHRTNDCRTCSTAHRRRRRDRRKVPCVRCGRPRLHWKDIGAVSRGGVDTGLCGACFNESHPRAV